MQNFAMKIRHYLKQNRNNRRYRAFALALSLVVAISVFGSLIVPAISMARDTELVTTLAAGDSVNFDGKDFTYQFMPSSAEIAKDNEGNDINNDVGNNEHNVKFKVNFDFEQNGLSERFIYCTVSDNVTIPDGGLPADGWGDIIDDKWEQDDHVSGKYKIVNIDGVNYIFIEFSEAYYQQNQTSPIEGNLTFEAKVSQKENEIDETATVVIGGKEIIIGGFTPAEATLEKSGVNNADSNTVTWTLTVDNPREDVLTDIADEQLAQATDVTVNPAGAGSVVDGKFVFADGYKDKGPITITYTTPYPTDDSDFAIDGKIHNSATLTKGDGTTLEKEADVDTGKKASVDKIGTADYENGKITWTIDINNPLGADLKDYIVKDAAFANASDITIKDSSGAAVEYTIDENGRVILGTTTSEKLTIEYTTDLDTTKDNTNEVRLQAPGTKNDNNWDGPSDSATVKNQFTISKGGSVNSATGDINWLIDINKYDDNSSLAGKVITDKMFAYDDDGQIKVTYISNYQNVGEIYLTPDVNGQITLPADIPANVNEVKIEYTTNIRDLIEQGVIPEGDLDSGINVTNTATLDKPNISDDHTVTVKNRNEAYKSHSNVEQKDGKLNIDWKITLKEYNGQFKGQLISDVMSAKNSAETAVSHKLVDGTIKVYYEVDGNGNFSTELPAENYTLTQNADGTFNIQLGDGELFDSISGIEIAYKTEVDLTGLEAGDIVTYENEVTYKDTPVIDKDTHEVKDENLTPYVKLDASTGSSSDTTMDINSMPIVTVDGEDYYRFDWKVVVNENKVYTAATETIDLVDTFPEGMKLYEEQTYLQYSVDNGTKYNLTKDTWNASYYGIDSEGRMHIYIQYNKEKVNTYYYSTIAKVSDVKDKINQYGSAIFKNTLQDIINGKPAVDQTQIVKIKDVTKESTVGKYGQDITYTIDVNPGGKKISKDDKITLTDTITCGDTANKKPNNGNVTSVGIDGNSAINMDLKSITVIDANTGEELDPSEYTYELIDPEPEMQSYNANLVLEEKGQWSAKLKLPLDSDAVRSDGTISITPPVSGKKITWYKIYSVTNGTWTKLEELYSCSEDNVSVNVKVPDNYASGSYISIEYGCDGCDTVSNEKILNSVTVSDFTKETLPFVKKLNITVPDERHLKIVYNYKGTPANPEDGKNASFVVSAMNNIAFDSDGSYVQEDDSNTTDLELIDQSTASSSTKFPLTVEKVDAGDYTLKLNARFKLWKYMNIGTSEAPDYQWVAAESFTVLENNKGYKAVWGSTADDLQGDAGSSKAKEFSTENGCYTIQLEDDVQDGETEIGYLYKIVETAAPNGYQLDSTPIYFAYRNRPEQLPDGFKISDYQFIENGSSFRITNLLEEINVQAVKVWSDGAENHAEENVTFALYKSYSKVSDLNSDKLIPVYESDGKTQKTQILNNDNNWTCSWNNLPGCELVDGAYKQLYYYVKEIDSPDGYEPDYSNNGLRKDGVVTVTNSKDLNITKEWKDQAGNLLDDSEKSEIAVLLYQSLTAPNAADRQNGSDGLPIDKVEYKLEDGTNVITLNSANNWSYVVENLPKADDNGNTYYYYVLEQSVPPGFSISYINGAPSTGAVVITNKQTPVEIEEIGIELSKIWSDYETTNHAGDTLEYNIHRSTDINDVPTNFNKFEGNASSGGHKVSFEVTSATNGSISMVDGSQSEFEIATSGSYLFNLYHSWFKDGIGTITIIKNSDSSVLDVIKCTGKTDTSTSWDKTSDYVSVTEYSQAANWETPYFVLKLDNVTEDITVKIELETGTDSTYQISEQSSAVSSIMPMAATVDPDTSSDITLIPDNAPYHGSESDPTFWKTVTLTGSDDWKTTVQLEKTNSEGEKYYYWIEEVRYNGQPVENTNYVPYYRYNGDTDSFYIDPGLTESQYIQVYNSNQTETGSLPETGGMGTAPFKAVGAAIAGTSATLLVIKRRRRLCAKKNKIN